MIDNYIMKYPLHHALQEQKFEKVKEAINADNINEPDDAGNTFLHLSAQKGYTDMAKFLIEKGANVNARSQNQYTPLNDSSYYGHLR